MSALLGGDNVKPLHVHDTSVRDPKQAAAMARRKIAEANRNGWQLNYTLAGHTAPSSRRRRLARGLDARHHGRRRRRRARHQGALLRRVLHAHAAPPDRDTIHLMRPEDLIFADPGSEPS
jgi:hypothetical protein